MASMDQGESQSHMAGMTSSLGVIFHHFPRHICKVDQPGIKQVLIQDACMTEKLSPLHHNKGPRI